MVVLAEITFVSRIQAYDLGQLVDFQSHDTRCFSSAYIHMGQGGRDRGAGWSRQSRTCMVKLTWRSDHQMCEGIFLC